MSADAMAFVAASPALHHGAPRCPAFGPESGWSMGLAAGMLA
jgi:hypothetical protein